MKDIIFKTCLTVMSLLAFSSCKVDDIETDVAYYPFTASDTENLLIDVPEVGEVLIFKN